MKLFVIAGEASGDLHGSNLIKALKKENESLEIRAWGGDLMSEAGADVVKHYRELAFMGFQEVLMNIWTILKNFKRCKANIDEFNPDALILIDYPGFNLRMAKYAWKKGIPVYYYISPQIWAWKKGRVHQIKKFVTKMYVILPFEKDFYAKYDQEVEFVGHPLLDVVRIKPKESFREKHGLNSNPIIAVLPGSRKQEISAILPLMMRAKKSFPEYQFVIAGAPSQEESFYQQVCPEEKLPIIFNDTYGLFGAAVAGFVTSGTATLEAALHHMPQVVCYKSSVISYTIAKKLVDIKYISLVNLIMDEEVVVELIQKELNVNNLMHEMKAILPGGNKRDEQLSSYQELKKKLGGSGASERTAQSLLKNLQERKSAH
jgi:lipid-A-disaccharide synthase